MKHKNHLKPLHNPTEYNSLPSPTSYNNHKDSSSGDTDSSRICQSRRIRRCNWVRFLTVYENEAIEEIVQRDLNVKSKNEIKIMHPNLDCHRNKAGQVVYELLETVEPGTELIAQFKIQDTFGNNNNTEDFYKKELCFKNSMENSFNKVVTHPLDINLLYSSQAISNMLLIDAISGIIKGMFFSFRN